ncbi:MAG: hypothetical protein UU93_C0010G0001, partial [Candidatus Amesbacteria bacterium GW2011_GWA2_42_12]
GSSLFRSLIINFGFTLTPSVYLICCICVVTIRSSLQDNGIDIEYEGFQDIAVPVLNWETDIRQLAL